MASNESKDACFPMRELHEAVVRRRLFSKAASKSTAKLPPTPMSISSPILIHTTAFIPPMQIKLPDPPTVMDQLLLESTRSIHEAALCVQELEQDTELSPSHSSDATDDIVLDVKDHRSEPEVQNNNAGSGCVSESDDFKLVEPDGGQYNEIQGEYESSDDEECDDEHSEPGEPDDHVALYIPTVELDTEAKYQREQHHRTERHNSIMQRAIDSPEPEALLGPDACTFVPDKCMFCRNDLVTLPQDNLIYYRTISTANAVVCDVMCVHELHIHLKQSHMHPHRGFMFSEQFIQMAKHRYYRWYLTHKLTHSMAKFAQKEWIRLAYACACFGVLISCLLDRNIDEVCTTTIVPMWILCTMYILVRIWYHGILHITRLLLNTPPTIVGIHKLMYKQDKLEGCELSYIQQYAAKNDRNAHIKLYT